MCVLNSFLIEITRDILGSFLTKWENDGNDDNGDNNDSSISVYLRIRSYIS